MTDNATDPFTECRGDQNHKNGSLQFARSCLNSAVIFTNLEHKTGAQNFRDLFSPAVASINEPCVYFEHVILQTKWNISSIKHINMNVCIFEMFEIICLE